MKPPVAWLPIHLCRPGMDWDSNGVKIHKAKKTDFPSKEARNHYFPMLTCFCPNMVFFPAVFPAKFSLNVLGQGSSFLMLLRTAPSVPPLKSFWCSLVSPACGGCPRPVVQRPAPLSDGLQTVLVESHFPQ